MTARPNPRLVRQTRHRPTYEYRCTDCSTIVTRDFREATFIARCESDTCYPETRMFKRVYTSAPAVHNATVDAHFNTALGRPISSMREFRSELSRANDAAMEHTGIESRYAPIDNRDYEAAGIDRAQVAETTKQLSTTKTFV